MFKKLKLKDYLKRAFYLLIGLAVMTTILGMAGLWFTKGDLANLLQEIEVTDAASQVVIQEVNQAGRDIREMIIKDDPESSEFYREKIAGSLKNIEDKLVKFKEKYKNNEDLAAGFEEKFNQWIAIEQKAVAAMENNNSEEARRVIIEECSPALDELLKMVATLKDHMEEQIAKLEKQIEGMIIAFIVVMNIILVIYIILSLWIAKKATNNIMEAMVAIEDAVTDLSKGNLETEVDYEADNEFGKLGKVFNFCFSELFKYVSAISVAMKEFSQGNLAVENDVDFIGEFKNIETSIDNFLEKISGVLNEVKEVSYRVSAGSGEISNAAKELAYGAENQSNSIELLSANMDEMSEKILSTAKYMNEIKDMMTKNDEAVQGGHEKMEGLQGAMEIIVNKSENIKDFITTINVITSETKLLALNASIEAARAGESGKGFAVVADAVSALANQTSDAAKSIAELIDETILAVDHGQERMNETAVALESIVDSSKEISKRVEVVSTVAKEEADKMKEMAEGVTKVADIIHDNSAASQQCAASSEELAAQAQSLKDLIGYFTFKES